MAKELCPIPNLIKCDVSPRSMTVDLTVETNVSELIWTAVFDAPIDADRLLLQNDIPRIGDKNPFLPSKYATAISPEPTTVPNVWDIRVSYDIMGAPPIAEGKAYDFGSRAIIEEVVAEGAYIRQVYFIDRETGKPYIEATPEIKDSPGIPYTNSAGDLFEDPLMKRKADILLTFWVLASKKTGEQVDNGTIYNFIGQTNIDPITICGIPAKELSVTIENITPTRYRYYQAGAAEPEDRYKLRFEVRIDKNATGYGTGVLSKGRRAKLYPRGASSGDKVLRAIWTSDIDSEKFPYLVKEKDVEIDYDVLLDGNGEILDQATGNTCYIGYTQVDQFDAEQLPLPTQIGSYART